MEFHTGLLHIDADTFVLRCVSDPSSYDRAKAREREVAGKVRC